MDCYNFYAAINKPTRITSHSATLIDHIWTNNFENYKSSGIIYTSISDPFPVVTTFSIDNNNYYPKNIISG